MLINAYCTHRNPPERRFPHEVIGSRDASDPELHEHLQGFIGYILQGGQREMTQSLYHVMRHLQRVQHHLSLTVEDGALESFAEWAWAANAIVFLEDGSVRDPSGDVLVSPEDGSSDPEARLPYPQDAEDRRRRTAAILDKRGVKVPESLPPVVGECEVDFRSPAEVARRCMALIAVAVRAESLASGNPIPVSELQQRMPQSFDAMSPAEKGFMADGNPERQAVLDFSWRYECLFILLWCLGYIDRLRWPSKLCDVQQVARLMFENQGPAMAANAQLRRPAEILDAVDLYFRLHWAARDASLNDTEPPTGLQLGVLQEQRHALNWLIRFEDAEWDDVDCPT